MELISREKPRTGGHLGERKMLLDVFFSFRRHTPHGSTNFCFHSSCCHSRWTLKSVEDCCAHSLGKIKEKLNKKSQLFHFVVRSPGLYDLLLIFYNSRLSFTLTSIRVEKRGRLGELWRSENPDFCFFFVHPTSSEHNEQSFQHFL